MRDLLAFLERAVCLEHHSRFNSSCSQRTVRETCYYFLCLICSSSTNGVSLIALHPRHESFHPANATRSNVLTPLLLKFFTKRNLSSFPPSPIRSSTFSSSAILKASPGSVVTVAPSVTIAGSLLFDCLHERSAR